MLAAMCNSKLICYEVIWNMKDLLGRLAAPQTCWSLISLHGVQTDPVQNSYGSSYFPDLVKNSLEDGRTRAMRT